MPQRERYHNGRDATTGEMSQRERCHNGRYATTGEMPRERCHNGRDAALSVFHTSDTRRKLREPSILRNFYVKKTERTCSLLVSVKDSQFITNTVGNFLSVCMAFIFRLSLTSINMFVTSERVLKNRVRE
jgi:hypothetical protein